MRLSSIIVPLLPLTLALPHTNVPRSASQILDTIATLNSSLAELTTAVNNFDGSLLGVLPQSLAVISSATKLDVTTLKATAQTSQSSNFTQEESQSIVSSLAGLIQPIQTSLDALKAKYPVFKKTLESPIVLLDLNILKKHTDGFINAVSQKVTPDSGNLLGFGKGIIDDAFDQAITVYQGN